MNIGTDDVILQYKLRHFQTSEKQKKKKKKKSLVQNTGNISLELCKSYKQSRVFAFVCLLDLQLSREAFPVTKDGIKLYLSYQTPSILVSVSGPCLVTLQWPVSCKLAGVPVL